MNNARKRQTKVQKRDKRIQSKTIKYTTLKSKNKGWLKEEREQNKLREEHGKEKGGINEERKQNIKRKSKTEKKSKGERKIKEEREQNIEWKSKTEKKS